jgi:hypothetical protein
MDWEPGMVQLRATRSINGSAFASAGGSRFDPIIWVKRRKGSNSS